VETNPRAYSLPSLAVHLTDDKELADQLRTSTCGSKFCMRFHELVDLQAGLNLLERIPDRYYERER
jgi:hypothetical protein